MKKNQKKFKACLNMLGEGDFCFALDGGSDDNNMPLKALIAKKRMKFMWTSRSGCCASSCPAIG